MMRNPVFESSMKRRMRSFRAPMLITLYVVFLVLFSAVALVTLQRATVTLGALRAGLESYIYLSVIQFALIILVAPALTAGSISGERERQTLDLLLCTRVGAVRIVLGKLLSNACFLGLMIITSLPVMATGLFFGGVSIWDMLLMELFLLVTALACCSIGVFCSALFRRTVTATVVAYLSIFAIGIGTLIIPMLLQRGALQTLSEIAYQSSSYGSGMVYIGGAQIGVDEAMETATRLPLLLYINPGVGLLSMLIEQTGLLQNTLQNYYGYGGTIFSVMNMIGSVAVPNMIIMAAVSFILVAISGLFVKPAGRKAKKHS